jgi:hypothetical protein
MEEKEKAVRFLVVAPIAPGFLIAMPFLAELPHGISAPL